jgi:hypothetical protein
MSIPYDVTYTPPAPILQVGWPPRASRPKSDRS